MPADAGIDNGGTGFFDGFAQLHHLIPGLPAFYKVQHRQAVNDNELGADRLPHAANDLHRQLHAVLERSAPFVSTLIGSLTQELVNEIPFRPHNLNAVITGQFRQFCGADEVINLLIDALGGERTGLERRNRRLGGRGGYAERLVAIAASMKQLQANLAASVMNFTGDMTVKHGGAAMVHGGRQGRKLADKVG